MVAMTATVGVEFELRKARRRATLLALLRAFLCVFPVAFSTPSEIAVSRMKEAFTSIVLACILLPFTSFYYCSQM